MRIHAIIVSVTPEDFRPEGPLAGIAFQRRLEEKHGSWAAGKSRYSVIGILRTEAGREAGKTCGGGFYAPHQGNILLPI